MSTVHGLTCDGCGELRVWQRARGDRVPTKSVMEQAARDQGWCAPDKIGRHFCLNCRTRAGAVQWWRKENVRRGLAAGYGLGQCVCAKHGPGRNLDPDCSSAGHPGVVARL